jgi:hypothetical protein
MKIKTSYNGSGLCNRLLYWNSIYPILEEYNAQMYVTWQDIEYLNIPYTQYGDFKENSSFSLNISVETIEQLKLQDLDYLETSNFDNFSRNVGENRYNLIYNNIDKFECNREMGLCKINIKDEYHNEFTGFENYIGVHIRKGDFCTYNQDVPIERYDEEMSMYKDSKFFISYGGHNGELNYNEIKYLYDKYDCIDFMKYNDNLVKICNFDLIGLSKCKYIIGTCRSSYSIVANIIGDNKIMLLDR